MLNKVLIIHPDGNSFNNPTIKCVIDLLCDRNVDVHILYQKNLAPMPQYRGVEYYPRANFLRIIKDIFLTKINSESASRLVSFSEYIFLPKDFDLIIGVDREGVIQASFLSRFLKKPYVFFSFEIMFADETTESFKRIERQASKSASKWFVQDAERSDLLQKENELDPRRGIELPLASKGNGCVSSSRLRDDLGVPEKCKVAMCMGSLSDWSMTPEIIRSTASWRNDWCLIVHGRYGKTINYVAKYLPEIEAAIGTRIFISETPTDMVDDMSWLLSGVDVGLAFYNPDYSTRYTGENLKCVGLAAGKISAYLRYGIPVIMNPIGMYSRLAEEYGFGLTISDFSELPSTLLEISPQVYSDAARQFFSSRLDFSLYEDRIWREIEGAATSI